jgi:D-sedoheptulose 7-phosphate isomerase
MKEINRIISDSIEVKNKILQDENLLKKIDAIVKDTVDVISNGGRLWFCGNGGSASDAQHLAAEFTGRFYKERKGIPAEALHCNSSYMTAVANDYGYNEVYSRLIDAVGKEGDILFCFSTSGESQNIINACHTCNKIGVSTIGFTGKDGGSLYLVADLTICVPSEDTPRIQEAHIMIGHIICELVEKELVERQLFIKPNSIFYKRYLNFYKPISEEVSIVFKLPNQLTPSFISGDDEVILEVFKTNNDSLYNLDECLPEICKIADETNVTIFVRGDVNNSNNIDIYTLYTKFKDFGFREDEIGLEFWYVRHPKNN